MVAQFDIPETRRAVFATRAPKGLFAFLVDVDARFYEKASE